MNLNLYNPFQSQSIHPENKSAQIDKLIDLYIKFKQNPDNFPTEVDEEGTKIWKNSKGQLHRVNGPAVICRNGSQKWYQNNQLHRLDGPASISSYGHETWYQKDKLHREDGPAVIYDDGTKKWYLNGQLHRLDGPAVIWADGKKRWHIYGQEFSEKEYYQELKKLL